MPFLCLALGGGLLVVHAQQQDAGNDVNKQQNADLPPGGQLVFAHLAQCDTAEDQGQDGPKAGDHTDDDEYFCSSFYVFSSYY